MSAEDNSMVPPSPLEAPRPLQLVSMDMEAGKVVLNEDALGRLEKRLREKRASKVAIVSVMGAFRTGKSFLLDLFLRFLRHEERCAAEGKSVDDEEYSAPERGGGQEFPLPAWITSAGQSIEGGKEEDCNGFRFKGGMDACTEGIWVWSEPFIRTINGEAVGLLLMDTQGAWDSNMTKEQSATIFGLTAVLSSKQIYNINMQIQEDKVENLAYFMRFAQAALRSCAEEMPNDTKMQDEVKRPFQSLDFLVRDWRHFKKDWTVAQCQAQMDEHLSRHLDPQKVKENSTAEAMHAMFRRIKCVCLPHPGLAIEEETWTGNVADISTDFLRLTDLYCREVFTEGLTVKRILGSELSAMTFPLVLRNFVTAFHDAAPIAMTFTEAMTNCTVLLAKEQVMKCYTRKMDEAAAQNASGMSPEQFEELSRNVSREAKEEYSRVTILGSEEHRSETWKLLEENLTSLHQRYFEDNSRRLEKALVAFANIGLLALVLFVLDRISDWVCDWWSDTCANASKLFLAVYVGIFFYIGVHTYLLFSDRGRIAAAVAGGELWKEIMRLIGVYGDLMKTVNMQTVMVTVQKAFGGGSRDAAEDAKKKS